MGMAERRTREKWGFNPRGTLWSGDKDKFGQKMLEKMGWHEGKGLGTTESGMTEHIKVRNKRDNLGIGASQKDADYNWLETQDTFNSLLKDLNSACGTVEGGEIKAGISGLDSVLESSKDNKKRGSRLRMFESRFRKSKDLSSMGESDLECITGASSKRPERFTKEGKERASKRCAEAAEEFKDQSGVGTIEQAESVNDYFARMLAKKREKMGTHLGGAEVGDGEAAASSTLQGGHPTSVGEKKKRKEREVTQDSDTKERKEKKEKRQKKEKDVSSSHEVAPTSPEYRKSKKAKKEKKAKKAKKRKE